MAQKLPGRGLTAHYFFTFGVEVQLVGDRKNTRVEQRILHLDVAAPAVKLIEKGSVRVFLRFDGINQIVFDDVEPRSVLISCRDDRRFFVVFQSAEDNLVFRSACSDLAAGHLDMNRFQRSVLKKGPLMKRGRAGALFGDRYAILTPRKLFILPSKVSVFPSNAVSLEEATPRFDDTRGTVHLDVYGKEYVFQGADKDESQDWFVEIARAATSKVPILLWGDSTAARMQAESADEQGLGDDDAGTMDGISQGVSYGGGYSSSGGDFPSHFTAPEDWQEDEETPDTHLDMAEPGLGMAGRRTRSLQAAANPSRGLAAGQQQQQQRGYQSWSGGGDSGLSSPGNVIKLGAGGRNLISGNGGSSGGGVQGRGLDRSWSGLSNDRSNSPQQQQPARPPSAGGSGKQLGTIFESGESDLDAAARQTAESGADENYTTAAADIQHQQQQHQQQRRAPPPAPPLRLAAKAAQRQQQQPRVQQAAAAVAPTRRGQGGRVSAAAAAIEAGKLGAKRQQQQQQVEAPSVDGFFADLDDEGYQRQQQQQQQHEPHSEELVDQEIHSSDDGDLDRDVYSEDEQPEPAPAQPPPQPARTSIARKSLPAAAAAAAAAAPRKQQQQGALAGARSPGARGQESHELIGTGGFMSPGSTVNLQALTDAVTARLDAAQQARSLRHSQLITEQLQQQYSPVSSIGHLQQYSPVSSVGPSQQQQQQQGELHDTATLAAAAAALGYQLARSPSPQRPYLDALQEAAAARNNSPAAAAAAGVYGAGSPAPSVGRYDLYNSSSGAQQQQQQQQHSPSYGYSSPPAGYGSPYQQQQQQQSPRFGVNSSPQRFYQSPTAANSYTPGASGSSQWTSTLNTTQRTVNFGSSPGVVSTSGSGARAPGMDSTNGWGRKSLAGLYSTKSQGSNSPGGGILGFNTSSSSPNAAATGRMSLAPLHGRLSNSGAAGSSPSSGVILGEYIIPSVFRVIVYCPEGLELAVQLRAKPDLTPHQCNLAMMRWAFGVYSQLPDDARTAVPSGPSRHNLNTWITPDINTLTQAIQQSQQQQQHAMEQQQQTAAAQLLQQISQHVTKTHAAAATGSPRAAAAEGAAATAAGALLATLVQTASGGFGAGSLSPNLNSLLLGFNPLLNPLLNSLNPGLCGMLNPTAAMTGPQGVALQRLLAAAAAGKDIPTILQEFAQEQLQQYGGSSGSPRVGSNSPRCLKQKHRHTAESDPAASESDAAAVWDNCHSRSSSPTQRHRQRQQQQQRQQQHSRRDSPRKRHDASSSSSEEEEDKSGRCSRHHRRSSSGNSSDGSSSGCGKHPRHAHHRSRHQRHTHSSSSSPRQAHNAAVVPVNSKQHQMSSLLLNPNMNVTVRLKRHHLQPASGLNSSRPSDGEDVMFSTSKTNNSADKQHISGLVRSASASSSIKAHRLRGHCSLSCDNPLYDLSAADAAAASTGRSRPLSAGASLGGTGSSSSRKYATVCHLSSAAAQTICQAASTAAAAAAAAVRSAVLTIDGDDSDRGD